MKLAGDFLHSYLAGGGNVSPPVDQDLHDLADGNLLLANAVIGMLAPLRRQSYDEVLDELPPRDEGFPERAAAAPMWATTVDLLRHAHANGWRQTPQPSTVYDPSTTFRNSFNLAVAVTVEFAAQIGQRPAQVAKTFADAATLADAGPAGLDEDRHVPGRSPRTFAWFGRASPTRRQTTNL